MVSCLRYTRSQKEYQVSSFSRRCAECIRLGKQYEPAVPVIYFSSINKAMEKLKRKEVEIEVVQEAANKIAY